ncbi:unnamed protein product [Calypogeia fissa]
MGKSVVVVETYIDPATQISVDIVIQTPSPIVSEYVDLTFGKPATSYVPPDPSAALPAYGAKIAKYPYLSLGYDLPYPVSSDLLLPFGDFVTKCGLQAAVDTIFQFAAGIGDLLQQPTIYVMKLCSLDLPEGLQDGLLITASHDNSEV